MFLVGFSLLLLYLKYLYFYVLLSEVSVYNLFFILFRVILEEFFL